MADRALSALVVGADSMIGRSLYERMATRGGTVYGTSRRSGTNREFVFLDLRSGFDEVLRVAKLVNIAFLCAGITDAKTCESATASSSEINVTQTAQLAKALCRMGVFVVFLSSSAVFAGDAPFQRAGRSHAPRTEYGRQKSAAERRLLSLDRGVAIVRLTKVFSACTLLIRDWIGELNAGRIICPFHDLYVSPISVQFAVDVLAGIGRLRQPGVYQVSGDGDFSYAELARLLANQLRGSDELVSPVSHSKSGAVSLFTGRYGSLDMQETGALLGVTPQPAESVVRDLLRGVGDS